MRKVLYEKLFKAGLEGMNNNELQEILKYYKETVPYRQGLDKAATILDIEKIQKMVQA